MASIYRVSNHVWGRGIDPGTGVDTVVRVWPWRFT